MLTRIRGTRDILNARLMHEVISSVYKKLINSCFTPVHLPILESIDLFQRSLGQGSDAVAKEMYIVKSIHNDDTSICLRPEATASVMRSYLINKPTVKPWKVFTCGSMFRHERPQKGRYREFTQISIEMLAAESSLYDAELIALLNDLFIKTFKITDYEIEINFLGSLNDRAAFKEILFEYIHSFNSVPEGILHTAKTNILRIFDLKDEECRQFMSHAPFITDYLSSESCEKWQEIKNALSALGVSYIHNPRLVRGLDYYNNTVFEFISRNLGSQNTFCAGGRYDDLATTLGSKEKVPSVGASIGVDRLMMLLQGEEIEQQIKYPHIAITSTNKEYLSTLLKLTFALREQDIPTELYIDKSSFKSALKKADADGAVAILIVGENEEASNSITVKNLKTGEQILVKESEVINYCKNLFL